MAVSWFSDSCLSTGSKQLIGLYNSYPENESQVNWRQGSFWLIESNLLNLLISCISEGYVNVLDLSEQTTGHACVYACMHEYLHVFLCTCMLVYVCLYVFLCVRMHVCLCIGLSRLPPRAKLQMASEQGILWLIESSLKYNVISYKIMHELICMPNTALLYHDIHHKCHYKSKTLLFSYILRPT